MDGLFSLIWVVFIVVTLTNALTGKNKKKKKNTGIPPITARPVTRQQETRSFQNWMNELASAQTAQPAAPATQQMRTEPEATPAPRRAPVAPKVHTHLSMDCDQDDPSGSMDFVSTEGIDPCHDESLPDRSTPRPSFPDMQEQPGLALEWNGDALVRSVIMQEVLTRPCQRTRR